MVTARTRTDPVTSRAIRARPSTIHVLRFSAHDPRSTIHNPRFALALLLALTLLVPTHAAVVGVAESWTNSPSIEGWEYDGDIDSLSHRDDGADDDPGGHLGIKFAATAFYGTFEEGRAYADSGSSGGNFVGNYHDAGAAAVGFRFLAEDYLPSYVDLHFYSATSGRTWMYYLDNPSSVGDWQNYNVQLDYNAGWTLGNPITNENEWSWFLADLSNVTWIGVNIARNPSEDAQFYGIDNFTLVIPEPGEWAMLGALAAALLIYMRIYGVGLATVKVLNTPLSRLWRR